MKKLFLALTALASLVTSASAQYASISDGALSPRYGLNKLIGAYSGSGFSVTNLHSSATNVNVTIDARFQSAVGLTVFAAMNGAGPTTLTIPFQRSPDGVNFDTTLQSIALSFGAGTNLVSTNITMYGMGYVRIPYVTNASGTVDCTNLVLLSPTKALSTPP